MYFRGTLPIDLIWVLVDLTHSRINDILTNAATKNSERLPNCLLSVNRNIDNTLALVKIATTEAALRALLPPAIESAIVRVYTEVDHAEAWALVSADAWTGGEVPPWRT